MLEPLSNKIARLKPYSPTKKGLQHRYFLLNIAKFSRTGFMEHLWWLLWFHYRNIKSTCVFTNISKSTFITIKRLLLKPGP